MRSITRATTFLAASAATALLVAACATDDGDVATDAGAADDEATEPAEDGEGGDGQDEAAADGAGALVALADTELGDVLVDGDGMTLYQFDADDQGPSQCTDDCAGTWPPLTTDGDPAAGDGVEAALLGTTERDDGELQVTYDDWPLYHFVGDDQPGDVAGQAVQDVWWVLDADGTPLRDAAATDSDAADGTADDATGGSDDEESDRAGY